ncbi:MAG: hypothetical protein AAFO07_17500 [Bacteroidota bacterium]
MKYILLGLIFYGAYRIVKHIKKNRIWWDRYYAEEEKLFKVAAIFGINGRNIVNFEQLEFRYENMKAIVEAHGRCDQFSNIDELEATYKAFKAQLERRARDTKIILSNKWAKYKA